MRTDTEIRVEGMQALVAAMGTVEAEKFIALVLREPFDYTKWQRSLWPGKTIDAISREAMEYRETQPKASAKPRRKKV